jgi:hypothetical protein
MSNHVFARVVDVSLLSALLWSSGCGSDRRGPLAPPSSGEAPPAAVSPPSVAAVFPAKGSTGGGAVVTVSGSGFQSGATVTFGAERQTANVESATTIRVLTSAHEVATVDIVVANPDGQVGRLTSAYDYASPQSFDFNGAWEGTALAHPEAHPLPTPRHSDMGLQFTIENNVLVSVTCGDVTSTFSPAEPVNDGAFALARDDSFVITGRIVSDDTAVGTINTGACPATR